LRREPCGPEGRGADRDILLSRAGGAHHRAVSGGRRHRHRRTRGGGADERCLEAAGDHREYRRRHGAIGAAQAARAPRDGYTLVTGVGTTTAILKALKPNLAFDPIGDFAPVSLLTTFPNILVVRGDFPAANVGELISVLRANPGKFTYASSGYGGSLHLAAELFKLTTGTDIVHVPYTGSAPAITALLGGHVDLVFDTMPSIWPSVQSGKLKALGVASRQRTPAAPDLPAVAESLPGFDVTSWEGILAPAGTPAAVVSRIADEIKRIVAEPEFARSLLQLGAVATSSTPQEFASSTPITPSGSAS
jgi:tripartite-type tricarboxylate transporter receptor subunit TctC